LEAAKVIEEKQEQTAGENTSALQIREVKDDEEKSPIQIKKQSCSKMGGEYIPAVQGDAVSQHESSTSLTVCKGDLIPKLSNAQIRTDPAFRDLCEMTEKQLSNIVDFELEHVQYGQIRWEESVDLRGVNLDEIVHFSQSSFEIYPEMDPKPEFGTGFMKPCSVMLYNVWPRGCNSTDRPSFEREERFRANLEKHCRSSGYTFITYDKNGVLEFLVENPC